MDMIADLSRLISIPENVRKLPLARLKISSRLRNALRQIHCQRLGDLDGLTYEEIYEARACGAKTILEFEALLRQLQDKSMACPAIKPQSHADTALDCYSTISVPETIRHLPVAHLNISARLRNVLNKIGCVQLGDLEGLTYDEILRTWSCGRKTITELGELLNHLQASISDTTEALSENHPAEPLEMAAIFIPQSARGWALAQMPLSTRLAGVLRKMEARVLGDLHGLSFAQILKARNCGRLTVVELATLISRVQSGELAPTSVEAIGPLDFVRFIDDFLSQLSQRNREILLQRFGGTGSAPVILEEIGFQYGLTRERVRQIIAKLIDRARQRGGTAVEALLKEIAERCVTAVLPLTPALFAHWIGAETGNLKYMAAFYLRLMAEFNEGIPAWPEGQRSLSKQMGRTPDIIRNLKGILRLNPSAITLHEALAQLKADEQLFDLTARELLEALRRDDSLLVEFAAPDQPRLRSPKLQRREWVRLVLSQAERPLTPEEIIDRARTLLGEQFSPPSPFSLANALKPEDGFYLLDRRAFGLRQHFRLPESSWESARADFHNLLLNRQRPLSTSEVIKEQPFDWATQTTAPELAQILREDERFIDLGRFLFALAAWGIEEREHLYDLIPKVLAQANHPLNVSEIARELQRFRSASLTSLPAMLRHHPEVNSYGFGYYGLRAWGDAVRDFMVSASTRVNRIIAQSEPPLTFGGLCQILEIPARGSLADRLWQTIKSLRKVTTAPGPPTPETVLSHQNWSLERALYITLARAERALPGYEIQWAINERFGMVFGEKSLAEIERCLRRGRFFIRNARGEYMLDQHLVDYGIDAESIRQRCLHILSNRHDIVDCADLLARLESEGVKTDNLSTSILASLLRDDEAFEEIGRNRFQLKGCKQLQLFV